MVIDKKNCSGCGLCAYICPIKCISMEPVESGFLYPIINENECIKCNKCLENCNALYNKNLNLLEPEETYAACSLNNKIRYNSTSGGLFSHLAIAILKEKGYVVGAAYYDDLFNVKHIMIDDQKDLERIVQSKYVQSDILEVLPSISRVLKEKKTVLFSGTPCQCAAVQLLFSKYHEQLFLCDFICRGVNSPKAYRAYLSSLQKQFNSKIKKVWFKNKIEGWNNFHTRIEFENKMIYSKNRYEDLYMIGYLKYNLFMRESCHICNYKGFFRVSDITLGDFWGIKLDGLDIEKGVSVVMLNSKKGKKIFSAISTEIFSIERTKEEVVKNNLCLIKSVPRGEYKDYFFSNLDRYGFDRAINLVIERQKNE